MKKLQNKLLKKVDADLYRKFRAYCITEQITVGQGISALLQAVMDGVTSIIKKENGRVEIHQNNRMEFTSYTYPKGE